MDPNGAQRPNISVLFFQLQQYITSQRIGRKFDGFRYARGWWMVLREPKPVGPFPESKREWFFDTAIDHPHSTKFIGETLGRCKSQQPNIATSMEHSAFF